MGGGERQGGPSGGDEGKVWEDDIGIQKIGEWRWRSKSH